MIENYKPIADYAIIGDQKTCALVGIDGSIDWLCVPRFDSPSVFCSILDVKKGGSFKIIPSGEEEFEARQYYDGQTNILLTEFRNQNGRMRITDFMPCFKVSGVVVSSAEIHRRVTCLEGKFDVDIVFEPRMNYGAVVPEITKIGDRGYAMIPEHNMELGEIALISQLDFEMPRKGVLAKSLSMDKQNNVDIVLRLAGLRYYHSQNTYTDAKLTETKSYWKRMASRCTYKGKWRDYIVRSALTLHLLVYSPTGAIIAAPTTSLPEKIGGVRNWDYRYSWIRDSSFSLWAFHSIGDAEEQSAYMDWLTSTFYLTIENLQIMLGVSGERTLNEMEIENLEGYMLSSPVRIGNGAWDQFQLDVYGILLDALYFSHKHQGKLSKKMYNHIVRPVIKSVEQSWEKSDCGIWEVRGEKKQFVYSKVWCWVALDRAVKIASELGMDDDSKVWSELKNNIQSIILEKGWNSSLESFVRSYDSKDVDSANLLMSQVGFIKGDDPRMLSTIEQVKKQLLTKERFLYRYKSEDGLSGDEGAFLICSFWLVSCLALAGKTEEGERLLESLLEYSNHVGLFSEEIDPESGVMLGNFPQAFTHMGLITAATDLEIQKDGSQKN